MIRTRVDKAPRVGAIALALTAQAPIGCSDPMGGQDECSRCHSSPDIFEDEFRGLDEETDPEDPGVGAHTQHLLFDDYTEPSSCDACHVVPDDVGQTGHFLGGRAEVRFGSFAATLGLHPRWDRETGTCSQVYCHGALPPDVHDDEAGDVGPTLSPAWDASNGESIACDGCHDNPPKLTRSGLVHPAAPACEACHPNAKEGPELTDRSLHVDGTVDML
jgi:predicted CxxxxCH...CXXCH cytochrome family protein